MKRKRWWLTLVFLLGSTALCLLSCQGTDEVVLKAKVIHILDESAKNYSQPSVAEAVKQYRRNLDKIRVLLEVQEKVAQHYDLSWGQYTTALRRFKNDPEVKPKLDRVKHKMRMHYKIPFEKVIFSGTMEYD